MGNFISANGLNSDGSSIHLSLPSCTPKATKKKRIRSLDFQLSNPDSIHVNLGFTRSWFQTPNPSTPKTHGMVRAGG